MEKTNKMLNYLEPKGFITMQYIDELMKTLNFYLMCIKETEDNKYWNTEFKGILFDTYEECKEFTTYKVYEERNILNYVDRIKSYINH